MVLFFKREREVELQGVILFTCLNEPLNSDYFVQLNVPVCHNGELIIVGIVTRTHKLY